MNRPAADRRARRLRSALPGAKVSSIQQENGDAIYYEYDFRSPLTQEKWYDSSMVSLYAYEYAYDGAGNRTRKTLNGADTYYEYDSVNRLRHAHATSEDKWTDFSYDPRGNTTQI